MMTSMERNKVRNLLLLLMMTVGAAGAWGQIQ